MPWVPRWYFDRFSPDPANRLLSPGQQRRQLQYQQSLDPDELIWTGPSAMFRMFADRFPDLFQRHDPSWHAQGGQRELIPIDFLGTASPVNDIFQLADHFYELRNHAGLVHHFDGDTAAGTVFAHLNDPLLQALDRLPPNMFVLTDADIDALYRAEVIEPLDDRIRDEADDLGGPLVFPTGFPVVRAQPSAVPRLPVMPRELAYDLGAFRYRFGEFLNPRGQPWVLGHPFDAPDYDPFPVPRVELDEFDRYVRSLDSRLDQERYDEVVPLPDLPVRRSGRLALPPQRRVTVRYQRRRSPPIQVSPWLDDPATPPPLKRRPGKVPVSKVPTVKVRDVLAGWSYRPAFREPSTPPGGSAPTALNLGTLGGGST